MMHRSGNLSWAHMFPENPLGLSIRVPIRGAARPRLSTLSPILNPLLLPGEVFFAFNRGHESAAFGGHLLEIDIIGYRRLSNGPLSSQSNDLRDPFGG